MDPTTIRQEPTSSVQTDSRGSISDSAEFRCVSTASSTICRRTAESSTLAPRQDCRYRRISAICSAVAPPRTP